MDILKVNTLYHPFQVGGAERSTQLLAEQLSASGHEVALACTKPEGGTEIGMVNGVRVYYLGLKNVYWQFSEETKKEWLKPLWHAVDSYNPFMQKSVAAIIDRETPDLVHTHNLGGFSVSAWRASQNASVPVVHTLRDHGLLCPRRIMYRDGANCPSQCFRCRPFAAPRRWLSHRITAVVGNSQFILDRHRSQGYFENVDVQAVIPNPIRLPEKQSVNTSNQKTPSRGGGNPLQVGFLGRLTPHKGIEQLLRVADAMAEETVHVRIGGTGDDEYVEALKREYASPKVTFCGYVDSDAFLPTLDVLVVPSRWHEPFGRVVVEAYAHGVPVIAAQRGGLPEIVDEGETGWTYDPDEDRALRERIKMLRSSPECIPEMRSTVRKKAQNYEVGQHAESYVEVYNRVIGVP